MKKIIVFALLLIMSATSFSQPVTNPAPTFKTDYLQKSRNQNTTAWFLAAGGVAGFAFYTFITAMSGFDLSRPAPRNHSFTIVTTSCISLIVGSVPLFIAASRNKRKALSLAFKNEAAPLIQKSSFVNSAIPSFTLNISL